MLCTSRISGFSWRGARHSGLVQTASPNPVLAYPECIQIDFWKSGQQQKKKTHEINFLQIGSKPHFEVVWNEIPIGFLSGCSNWISKCLLCHLRHDTRRECLNTSAGVHAATTRAPKNLHWLILTPTLLPQQPMQIGWWRLDTQIRSDHLQIKVQTVVPKDVETNPFCLRSEHSLRQVHFNNKNKKETFLKSQPLCPGWFFDSKHGPLELWTNRTRFFLFSI